MIRNPTYYWMQVHKDYFLGSRNTMYMNKTLSLYENMHFQYISNNVIIFVNSTIKYSVNNIIWEKNNFPGLLIWQDSVWSEYSSVHILNMHTAPTIFPEAIHVSITL